MTNPFRMEFNSHFLVTCFAALAIIGCASSYTDTNTLPTNQTFDAVQYDAAQASKVYKPVLRQETFEIGDVATVTMNGFKEFSGIYTVGNDGNIYLGHIGNVSVLGKTVPEVQKKLREQYGTCCLVNPNVSVEREGQVFGKIVVDGAVNDAGVFEIDEVIKFSEAVAIGGGVNDVADVENIILARVIDGERKLSQLNLKDIRLSNAIDPSIYPGDVIFVQDNKGSILYKDIVKASPIISAIIIGATR